MREKVNVASIPTCVKCKKIIKDQKEVFCLMIKKYGFYFTKRGEKIQRYQCLKSYKTFSKYTNDVATAYMRTRDLPFEEIKKEYTKEIIYTLHLLSEKYKISVSSIRTVLKRMRLFCVY